MDFEQLEEIGYNYVTGLLSPASAFGRRALKKLKPYTPSQTRDLEDELRRVQAAADGLKGDTQLFDALLHDLSQVKDVSPAFLRIGKTVLDEVELFEIKAYLMLCAKIKDGFEILNAKLNLTGIDFADTCGALSLLSKSGGGGFFIGPEYSNELDSLRKEKEKTSKLYLLEKDFEKKEEYKALHLHLAVKEEAEEYAMRHALTDALIPFAAAMKSNAELIARLDLIICKAGLSVRFGAVKPIIGDILELKGAYNPMIESFLSDCGKVFTRISINANKGTTVITGANMGGKTVALKTVALNAHLALCGFFVFAEYMTLPLFSFMDISGCSLSGGDTRRGLSSFGGEAVRLDSLYKKSRECGLILIDELAGGTNADEGARIFRAALQAFNLRQCTVIMTTHFDGVACFAGAHYQVAGLKNAPLKEMKELYGKALYDGVSLIAKYMDYGLREVEKDAEVPKDAITVCRLLGLSKDILDKI